KKQEKAKAVAEPNDMMASLFGNSISDELLGMDVMTMTPIEAMNTLYRLQQQAKEEAGRG
ncbi:MAG TPA: hypothetical protein DCR09_04250, partial [Anaerovibrio sp.]|nr:hypothetical protein [Anaerovibrio sp.]